MAVGITLHREGLDTDLVCLPSQTVIPTSRLLLCQLAYFRTQVTFEENAGTLRSYRVHLTAETPEDPHYLRILVNVLHACGTTNRAAIAQYASHLIADAYGLYALAVRLQYAALARAIEHVLVCHIAADTYQDMVAFVRYHAEVTSGRAPRALAAGLLRWLRTQATTVVNTEALYAFPRCLLEPLLSFAGSLAPHRERVWQILCEHDNARRTDSHNTKLRRTRSRDGDRSGSRSPVLNGKGARRRSDPNPLGDLRRAPLLDVALLATAAGIDTLCTPWVAVGPIRACVSVLVSPQDPTHVNLTLCYEYTSALASIADALEVHIDLNMPTTEDFPIVATLPNPSTDNLNTTRVTQNRVVLSIDHLTHTERVAVCQQMYRNGLVLALAVYPTTTTSR